MGCCRGGEKASAGTIVRKGRQELLHKGLVALVRNLGFILIVIGTPLVGLS